MSMISTRTKKTIASLALVLLLAGIGSVSIFSTASAQVPKAPKPAYTPPVASIAIGNIITYDTSAIITGQITNTNLFGYGMAIMYGPDGTIFPGLKILIVGPSGYFAAELTGLTPLTTYYFQVASTDPAGNIALMNPRSFRTKNTLLDIHVEDITQTSATIAGRVGTATPKMTIFTDKDGQGTFTNKYVPVIQGDRTFRYNLTDLKPGHSYAFIAVRSSDPTVRLSGVRTFATLSVSATPYVQETGDTFVVIAAKMSNGATNPAVSWGKNPDVPTGEVPLVRSDNVYTARISGLEPDTGYSYKIVGSDGTQKVAYTGIFSFLTTKKDTTPPTVTGVMKDSAPINFVKKVFTGGLVVCGKNGPLTSTAEGDTTTGQQSCSFEDLIKLVNNIIDFLIFLVAPIIMVFVLLWAGLLILTSGGSSEKISQAKGMIFKAIIGMVIAMSAWLIVKYVMVTLGYNDSVFPKFY